MCFILLKKQNSWKLINMIFFTYLLNKKIKYNELYYITSASLFLINAVFAPVIFSANFKYSLWYAIAS